MRIKITLALGGLVAAATLLVPEVAAHAAAHHHLAVAMLKAAPSM